MTIARMIAGRQGPIITCTPEQTVREAARLLADNRIGCLPVTASGGTAQSAGGESADGESADGESLGGEVVGIFSERDLLYCIAREGGAVLERPVGQVMTAPPITIDQATQVLTALSLMTRRRVRHLPVTQGGRLVGFVSIGDLVKDRIDRIEHEAQAMREYISQG